MGEIKQKLLAIEDLYVQYETDDSTVYAVNGLNIDIDAGETVGLVGETGAGKTSTALSIMKLLPDRIGKISQGKIILNGIEITKATEGQMQALRGETVSMIFQDPMTSLNPVIKVGRQIEEVLKMHRKDMTKEELQKRVDEMLELIGISPDRKNEYPHQFSGGMKQRIVIAIALACEPMLLLADEPTTALDVTIQAQVLQMMNELKKKFNTSILLITHDLGVIAQTCDRVAVVYAGTVAEIGTTYDIFAGDEHHPYTKGLFGSIPHLNADEKRLHPIEGLMPDPTNPAKGCGFAERCPYAKEVCMKERPPMREKAGHQISCHFCRYPLKNKKAEAETDDR